MRRRNRAPLGKRWIRGQIGEQDGPWNKKISPTSASHEGGEFALFYKREHARQSVFDGARAILVHLAAETDWIRHIAPHRGARFFKFTN